MRGQTVAAALAVARGPCAPQHPSVSETVAPCHCPDRGSAVKPPQTVAPGHTGAQSRRGPGEDTGTRQSGGRPQPQDEAEHF